MRSHAAKLACPAPDDPKQHLRTPAQAGQHLLRTGIALPARLQELAVQERATTCLMPARRNVPTAAPTIATRNINNRFIIVPLVSGR